MNLGTKLSLLAVIICLLPQVALATPEELEGGFKLGKFYVSTQLLAMELEIVQRFSAEFRMAEMTDENYKADVINDEDIERASLCLAYTLWRLQFLVIPLCEEGISGSALDNEYLDSLREQTMPLLESLLVDSTICVNAEDFQAVSRYANLVEEAGYVPALLELADAAKALVEGEAEVDAAE